MKLVGYIMVARKKRSKDYDFMAPMSFGKKALEISEPSPDILLFRGNATIFDTRQDALSALESTIQAEKELGNRWFEKYYFQTIEVTRQQA